MIEIQQLENALNDLREVTVKLKEKQQYEVVAELVDERKRVMIQISEMTKNLQKWINMLNLTCSPHRQNNIGTIQSP